MQCRSCRNILPDDTEKCPFCGASPSTAFSEFSSYEDDTSAGSIRYIPYTQAQPGMASPVASDAQPSAGSQWSALPPTYTHPGFYGTAQRLPASESPPSPLPEQKFAAPQAPARRGGLSLPVVILLVVLALCLGVGGTFAFLSIGNHTQDQTSAGTQTNGGNSTSTLAQGTKTLDTSNPQTLYTQATSGTPTFSADASTNWTALKSNTCTFSGSALQVTSSQQQATSSQQDAGCLANSTSFSNFALQTNVTFGQPQYAILFFRLNEVSRTGYGFAISSGGLYEVMAVGGSSLGGANAKILAGATSSAINTGAHQQNLLTVIALGSSLYFYINQQYVTTVNDTQSSSGEIAVGGGTTNGTPVNMTFSDIRVWQL